MRNAWKGSEVLANRGRRLPQGWFFKAAGRSAVTATFRRRTSTAVPDGAYRKLVYHNGRLAGALLYGDITAPASIIGNTGRE